MNARIATGALTGALMLALPALAQTTTGPVIVPGGAVDLAPGDEVVVREYVIRRRPALVEGAVTVRPGSVVPEFVELQPFVEVTAPALRRYVYFVSPDNKIVLVEPATRQVVRILDR